MANKKLNAFLCQSTMFILMSTRKCKCLYLFTALEMLPFLLCDLKKWALYFSDKFLHLIFFFFDSVNSILKKTPTISFNYQCMHTNDALFRQKSEQAKDKIKIRCCMFSFFMFGLIFTSQFNFFFHYFTYRLNEWFKIHKSDYLTSIDKDATSERQNVTNIIQIESFDRTFNVKFMIELIDLDGNWKCSSILIMWLRLNNFLNQFAK